MALLLNEPLERGRGLAPCTPATLRHILLFQLCELIAFCVYFDFTFLASGFRKIFNCTLLGSATCYEDDFGGWNFRSCMPFAERALVLIQVYWVFRRYAFEWHRLEGLTPVVTSQ